MTELKDDLDRALRSVTFGEAPVRQAMRDGRRLRHRRRLTVLAGAVAVVAVAAGYPALTRDAATAPPVTGRTVSPAPSPTGPDGRDPVVTDGPPAPGAPAGVIAQGTAGAAHWAVTMSGGVNASDEVCYRGYAGPEGKVLATDGAYEVTSACAQKSDLLFHGSPPNPASITGGAGSVTGSTTMYEAALGEVAQNVTYLVLDFTDGQQFKLIPVAYRGHRYIAWLAPASMTISRVTAHLGTAHFDSGQTSFAIPYDPPDSPPVFTLWFSPGQALPPTASGIIGGGTDNGQVWSESAYQGPWGTCFSSSPGNGEFECVPLTRLGTTEVLGGWGSGQPGQLFGSAAPGVKRVVITLTGGKSAVATPIAIGNERLFAIRIGRGVSPTGWTAYDAAGHKIGSRTLKPPSGG